jgi:hypothetical protein
MNAQQRRSLIIAFDREQGAIAFYFNLPWTPTLPAEIRGALRAAEAAAMVQGLRQATLDEVQRLPAGPQAELIWNYGTGHLEVSLSEEPLTEREQAVVAAAVAAAGWQVNSWRQGSTRLPLLEEETPQPFGVYRLLPSVACPARHPPAVLAVGRCDHCAWAVTRFGVWPTRCATCGSDRDRALQLMEQQGYVCPICLPMRLDCVGLPRSPAVD